MSLKKEEEVGKPNVQEFPPHEATKVVTQKVGKKDEIDPKVAWGCATIVGIALCVILFFVFIHWYSLKEQEDVFNHGVWTIITVTDVKPLSDGCKIKYTFELNDEVCQYQIKMPGQKAKVGDRFFVLAVPNDLIKHRVLNDPIPEWYYLDPPSEGWKVMPTRWQLWNMLSDEEKEIVLEKEDIRQDQTEEDLFKYEYTREVN